MKLDFDVIVVGSGAAGMMSALAASSLTSRVAILEKNSKFGGSSALSGGQIWIPNNSLQKRHSISDSPDLAFRYIKTISMGRSDDKLIRTFVEKAPEAFDFLITNTKLSPILRVDEPDYRPEIQGALSGGRTIDPGLFDGTLLGKEYPNLLHNPQYHFMGNLHVTSIEYEKIMRGEEVLELETRKPTTLSLGEALIASMRKALMDRRIKLYLSCRAKKLLFDGRSVYGIEALFKGKRVQFYARSVILAAGGFDWNLNMKKDFLEFYSENSAGCETNKGDGIIMGMSIGASVSLMDQAWWFTLIKKPNEKRGYLITSERTLPGSIIVNKYGKRFANEAMNYNDLVREMIKYDTKRCDRPNIPSYLIFDHKYASRYLFMGYKLTKNRPKFIVKAKSIRELASKLSLNASELERTVNEFNEDAIKGIDSKFGRGENIYDFHWGDRLANNTTLAPINRKPFYGVRILAGDIGTKGGLLINEYSQVINNERKIIKNLYAAGNNACSVMGLGYAGSGATLGPCITFGYIAGINALKHI